MPNFEDLPHEEQLALLERVAKNAVAHYDVPSDVSVEMINLSENATYRVDDHATSRKWALRVHREGYHSYAAIQSEHAWTDALREQAGVITPVIVPGKDGKNIQSVEAEGMPGGPRNVVMFDWESGIEPPEENLIGPFELLGSVSAQMHKHSKHWQRPEWFERYTWDFETSIGDKPHWGRWQDGMGVNDENQALFGRTAELINKRLQAFGQGPDRWGLVHCDIRLANLLIEGSITKVIDFDDCGFSWFMYDCATALSFIEGRKDVPELIQSWVKGYRSVMELSQEDEAEIPTFIMLRRLLLVAWIGSHSETDLAQSMGLDYTKETENLCEKYLTNFS
ncbi:MAG: phosphotransferase [Gammaproteobacteria bacterium]|nr:phosphotransferase [Gammaproteobacteria bacterium]